MTDEIPTTRPRRSRRAASSAGALHPLPDEQPLPDRERRPAAPPDVTASLPEPAPTVIRVERGGIDEATAGNVEVRMGGIGRLDAEEVFVQWGGIGAARADRLGVELGGLGAGLSREMRLTQGVAGTVVSREATLEQSYVRTLIAQRVIVNRPTGVLVMFAGSVSGDVRPLLDWRGALAAGAAIGLLAGLARTVRART